MTTPRPIPAPPGQPDSPDPRRLLAANTAAVTFYAEQLDGRQARGVRDYLRVRGLRALTRTDGEASRAGWLVGYAPPSWMGLTQALRAMGFADRELVAAGLSIRTRDQRLIDRFRDRLIFPIRDPAGHPLGFIGRAAPAAGQTTPKYLNTPKTPLYRKGTVLFGVAEQQERINAGWRPVVVEGPIDAIAVWLSYPHTARTGAIGVASCGTTLTSAQAAILRNMPGAAKGIVVAYDDDPAGHAATDRAWSELRDPVPAGPLLAAGLTGGDPADLLRTSNGHAGVRAAVQDAAYPLVQAVIEHRLSSLTTRHPRLLEDIGGRCAALRAVTPLLFETATAAEAAHLATRVAERIGVGLDTVAIVMAEHVDASVHDAGAALARAARQSRPPPPPAASRAQRATVLAFPPLRAVRAEPSTDLPAAAGDHHPRLQDRIRR